MDEIKYYSTPKIHSVDEMLALYPELKSDIRVIKEKLPQESLQEIVNVIAHVLKGQKENKNKELGKKRERPDDKPFSGNFNKRPGPFCFQKFEYSYIPNDASDLEIEVENCKVEIKGSNKLKGTNEIGAEEKLNNFGLDGKKTITGKTTSSVIFGNTKIDKFFFYSKKESLTTNSLKEGKINEEEKRTELNIKEKSILDVKPTKEVSVERSSLKDEILAVTNADFKNFTLKLLTNKDIEPEIIIPRRKRLDSMMRIRNCPLLANCFQKLKLKQNMNIK